MCRTSEFDLYVCFRLDDMFANISSDWQDTAVDSKVCNLSQRCHVPGPGRALRFAHLNWAMASLILSSEAPENSCTFAPLL